MEIKSSSRPIIACKNTMAKVEFLVTLLFSCVLVFVESYRGRGYDSLRRIIKAEYRKDSITDTLSVTEYSHLPVYVGSQTGLKEADKIKSLPGQPDGVNFDQYSGYVTVDAQKGRALFYYFVESPHNPSSKPLVLWLNGGPGCSSFGNGGMKELGPFRVKSDGETLYRNKYAWNEVANIIFLESPAGVGFSYSNSTSDYELTGDRKTTEDSYTFLINWLERFPEYKSRDFFIAGESYAGHYIPQLAQLILHNNNNSNQTIINLKGIAMGNAYIDYTTYWKGVVDYYWTHTLISDETRVDINLNCNFSLPENISKACDKSFDQVERSLTNINTYDIYAPLCNSSSSSSSATIFDPCSDDYIYTYLNNRRVQNALHANVTSLPDPWDSCSQSVYDLWKDQPPSMLPVIQELMASDISVWIYSGDTDSAVPVTATKYAIKELGIPVKTHWYSWYSEGEVAGYTVEYQNLTFVTVRGAGHFVPSYQPARALTLFSSFLDGKLPPPS